MAQKKRSSNHDAAPAPLSLVKRPQPPRSAIGRHVRQLREQRGLSLAALAAQSGAAVDGLAAIEAGEREPSIDLTWSLAHALGVTFSALVQDPPSAAPRPRSRLSRRALITGASRGDEASKPSTELHELKLPARGAERALPPPHGSRETLLVTAGRVIVHCAAEELVLGPGDSHVFAADAERYYVNPGETDAVMYAMVAPA